MIKKNFKFFCEYSKRWNLVKKILYYIFMFFRVIFYSLDFKLKYK